MQFISNQYYSMHNTVNRHILLKKHRTDAVQYKTKDAQCGINVVNDLKMSLKLEGCKDCGLRTADRGTTLQ